MKDVLCVSIIVGLVAVLVPTHLRAQTEVASQSERQSLVNADVSSVNKLVSTEAPQPHDGYFVIGNGDILAISVWKQPDLSRSVPVRSDGRISLPLIGEIQASGKTPLALEEELTSKFQPFLNVPEVTVIVEQINSEKFNILGKVAKPGSYQLVNPTTVLDAIALAGGCREFAKQKAIYILRRQPDGTETRIPFNYQDVIKGRNTAQNIPLKQHDTVVVP
ncbi:MAG TPA: polysaccharide biosynthesis/export family protein [Terriglobales bacterium]|nr:polysaccharide biosynthesis/export family protein [Terriglobales bacterium]